VGCSAGFVAALAAIAIAIAFGARYRLTISTAGIELVLVRAWVVPMSRARWPLSAQVSLYDSWDDDEPQGLCVTPRGSGPPESDCFGPRRSAEMRAVCDAAEVALARCRAAAR
jgi:hypothetical protein